MWVFFLSNNGLPAMKRGPPPVFSSKGDSQTPCGNNSSGLVGTLSELGKREAKASLDRKGCLDLLSFSSLPKRSSQEVFGASNTYS